MKRHTLALAVAGLLGILAGLLLCNRRLLCLDPTIGAGELINAALVLLVFLLANQIYSKLNDADRRRNDLLFSLVEDILADLAGVENAFLQCWGKSPIDAQSAQALVSAFRRFGNAILALEESVQLCKKAGVTPTIDKIKDARFKYKNLLTGKTFPGAYEASVWPRRETMHGDMLRSLRKLQFDLTQT